ncbi:MAG: maltose acetyltransferase domain-containing protein, partial [Candidatus Kapabacteria bacterium]|nr:maltose acetyltransferase domain-containing protein [Candidatus Kapabacteria bacterium]
MTEEEKCVAGIEYDATDKAVDEKINRVRDLVWEYNNLRPTMIAEREAMIRKIFGKCGKKILVLQPF